MTAPRRDLRAPGPVRRARGSIAHGEVLGQHTGAVNAVAALVLPGGRPVAVTGGFDATVRVWDLNSGAPVGDPLTGHTGAVNAVAAAVLPDGRPVAVSAGVDGTARVWDLERGRRIGRSLTGHQGRVYSVAVLPGRRPFAVTGGEDETVRVWDLASHQPIGDPLSDPPDEPSGAMVAVAPLWLPDGSPVVVTGSSAVQVWDLDTTASTDPPRGRSHRPDAPRRYLDTGAVDAVAVLVLPDGRALAVSGGADATVRVWDLDGGTPVGDPFTGHTGPVYAVATLVLPDGRAAAVTGGADATVRVWDLAGGAPVGDPFTGHTAPVHALAALVLPDGRAVAVSAGWDTTVRVWELGVAHRDAGHAGLPASHT